MTRMCMTKPVINPRAVSQKAAAFFCHRLAVYGALSFISFCVAPQKTRLPDPIWGFYDENAAERIRSAYEVVSPNDVRALRALSEKECKLDRAVRGSFLGHDAYTIGGFAEEKNPGLVCNWNEARELIFYGRFNDKHQPIIAVNWFLNQYLRSVTIRLDQKNVTVFRAWSISHEKGAWRSRLVHVDIKQNAQPHTLRFVFNRLDGGLLERSEFLGDEPSIEYVGLFFTSALKRGEPNCLFYRRGIKTEILSREACKIPDTVDPELVRILP